ncbi:hypothetical protein VP1G_07297 [Cytospora mali]|uniref:Uncharacterized protein n=1 Tax=Cytospora mali TaxID=578113 RepID=A0A194V859_CYTMA|nr:hypothetical protein VP1G_07297 [Valsa mali var. pyri (nom. inval.)]
MSDPIVYDYTNPKYDKQRNQWYWEGRRTDTGKKVRKYDTGQGQTTQSQANQYDPTGYQSTSYHATGGIEAGMQAMNLQQQPVDPYNTNSSNYVTWQTEVQPQVMYQVNPATRKCSLRLWAMGMEATLALNGPTVGMTTLKPHRVSLTMDFRGGGHEDISPIKGKRRKQMSTSGMKDEILNTADRSTVITHMVADEIPDDPRGHLVIEQEQTVDKVRLLFPHEFFKSLTAMLILGAVYASSTGSQNATFQESPSNSGVTGDDDDDPELRAGIEASHRMYGYGGAGGAGETSKQGGSAYRPDPGVVPPTTPHSRSAKTHISGTTGQFEPLDKKLSPHHALSQARSVIFI